MWRSVQETHLDELLGHISEHLIGIGSRVLWSIAIAYNGRY